MQKSVAIYREWGTAARRPQGPYCTKGTYSMLVSEVKATHTHKRIT